MAKSHVGAALQNPWHVPNAQGGNVVTGGSALPNPWHIPNTQGNNVVTGAPAAPAAPAPAPAVPAPAPTPAAPVPAGTPDQVYGTAEWQHAMPGFTSRFSQLMTNYGIVPDAATLEKYGLSRFFDAGAAAGAARNPYSVAALLQNTHQGTLERNGTVANAHGGLFSGAFVNSQDQADRDYTKNLSLQSAKELGDLTGVQGDAEALYGKIYDGLQGQVPAANTAATPTATPTAAPSSLPTTVGAAVGGSTGVPVPQGPYQRQGPEAGGKPVKLPQPPVLGGRGHIT